MITVAANKSRIDTLKMYESCHLKWYRWNQRSNLALRVYWVKARLPRPSGAKPRGIAELRACFSTVWKQSKPTHLQPTVLTSTKKIPYRAFILSIGISEWHFLMVFLESQWHSHSYNFIKHCYKRGLHVTALSWTPILSFEISVKAVIALISLPNIVPELVPCGQPGWPLAPVRMMSYICALWNHV